MTYFYRLGINVTFGVETVIMNANMLHIIGNPWIPLLCNNGSRVLTVVKHIKQIERHGWAHVFLAHVGV